MHRVMLITGLVLLLGSASAHAQWALYAHTEITDKAYQPPPEYFSENRNIQQQPPTVTAYYYGNFGKPDDDYVFQMQWADPPPSVADGATITLQQTITRVHCPSTGCPGYSVGLRTWAEASADGMTYTEVAALVVPNHKTSAFANYSQQRDSADPTFYLTSRLAQAPPYIRIRIGSGDGGVSAVLATYYYANVGVVRPPPQAPLLISPANGATVSRSVPLVWQQNGSPGYPESFYLEIYAWTGTAWSPQPVWQGWAASPFPFTAGSAGYFGWLVYAVDGNHFTDPNHQSNPWYAASESRWFYAQ